MRPVRPDPDSDQGPVRAIRYDLWLRAARRRRCGGRVPDSWIGKTVGNCRIEEKIGEGGCGAVYRGVDLMLDRPVAIKVLHPRLASRRDLAERFRSEALTLPPPSPPNGAP